MAVSERLTLTQLVEVHYEDIKAYIQRRAGSSATASDIVQETWLRAARHSTKQPDKPLAYLYRTATNLLLDKHRQDTTHGRYLGESEMAEEVECPLTPPDEAAGICEELEILTEALRGLPEKYRTVFQLSRCEGFTMREIATQMNINESTVEKQIAKGIQHCRTCLARGYVGTKFRFASPAAGNDRRS
ncbi:putative RNA polymerase sigma factor FecI [Pseudomonas fluorescens]|uniref:Putative RNA polymerase sigma factor FecI n=1 Tax=Pseudomonas fluorescens TaxID=294 RepID=A0A5E7SF06_PSEFL|nr:RNA polymerase sigma factor [Pseudomonas fluorescens]VVP85322.1 putative RNA polymerase sigma factor FecI [Pseudomonas fluorescens]